MNKLAPLLLLLAACGAAPALPPAHAATSARETAARGGDARRLLTEAAAALRKGTKKADTQADALLKKAVARDPSLWQAHHDLGVLALRRGDEPAARTHFGEAHTRAPDAVEPALALAAVDPERADKLLVEVLARVPDHHAARLTHAAVLRARGDFEGAAREARTVLHAQPTALAPLLELARAEHGAKRSKLAALVLERAETVAGPRAAIENERGLLALDGDDAQAALDHFTRATELDARFVPAHVNRAALLLRGGDATAAERAYRAALKVLESAGGEPGGSSEPDVRVGLGVALRAQNQHRAARREYERVLAAHPDHPAALFDLGVLLAESLDERKQAIAPFERYLASTPASAPHRARAERYLEDLRMSVGGPAP
ncbi:MAG: tetratricopeptide repeat protein [Polyangiales bacterium]